MSEFDDEFHCWVQGCPKCEADAAPATDALVDYAALANRMSQDDCPSCRYAATAIATLTAERERIIASEMRMAKMQSDTYARAERAEATAAAYKVDAGRLDWLDYECKTPGALIAACEPGGLRAAIDAAIEAGKQSTTNEKAK